MNNKIKIEICVDSVESALAAIDGGADRVELCDNLLEGGTTPSFASIEIARNLINKGLHVIIRPRGGDFLYSDLEIEIMSRDIEICRQMGVEGVVFGLLKANGEIDYQNTKKLIDKSYPMKVTFHRAFDVASDYEIALDNLIELGVNRILTSGQEPTAFEGIENIKRMVEISKGRIIVMGCGGLNQRNIKRFVEYTNVPEVHLTAFENVQSKMEYKNFNIFMGGTLRPPEFERNLVTSSKVLSIIKSLK